MGDRCYVELTVLNAHVKEVKFILGADGCDDEEEGDQCTVFGFEEVNYGTLTFLDWLTDLGIAWDSHWHGGDEYGPGTKHLRFAGDGTVQITEYDAAEVGKIETSKLLEVIDLPGSTVSTIKTFILDDIASFTPLPWEGQEENGKRHRALKLIGGT